MTVKVQEIRLVDANNVDQVLDYLFDQYYDSYRCKELRPTQTDDEFIRKQKVNFIKKQFDFDVKNDVQSQIKDIYNRGYSSGIVYYRYFKQTYNQDNIYIECDVMYKSIVIRFDKLTNVNVQV